MRNQHCTQDAKTSNVIFGRRAWWAAFNWVFEQLEWSRTELNKLGRVPAIRAVAKLTGSRGFKPKALWSDFLVKSVHWQPLPICEVCRMHIQTKSRLHKPAGGQFSSIRRWPTFLLQILHVRHLNQQSRLLHLRQLSWGCYEMWTDMPLVLLKGTLQVTTRTPIHLEVTELFVILIDLIIIYLYL